MGILFNTNKIKLTVPYKVKQMPNSSILLFEASGIVNEELFYFHIELECKDEETSRNIYLLLNENILKEIPIEFDELYMEGFKFDFTDILGEDRLDNIKVLNKKLLNEGTI